MPGSNQQMDMTGDYGTARVICRSINEPWHLQDVRVWEKNQKDYIYFTILNTYYLQGPFLVKCKQVQWMLRQSRQRGNISNIIKKDEHLSNPHLRTTCFSVLGSRSSSLARVEAPSSLNKLMINAAVHVFEPSPSMGWHSWSVTGSLTPERHFN